MLSEQTIVSASAERHFRVKFKRVGDKGMFASLFPSFSSFHFLLFFDVFKCRNDGLIVVQT